MNQCYQKNEFLICSTKTPSDEPVNNAIRWKGGACSGYRRPSSVVFFYTSSHQSLNCRFSITGILLPNSQEIIGTQTGTRPTERPVRASKVSPPALTLPVISPRQWSAGGLSRRQRTSGVCWAEKRDPWLPPRPCLRRGERHSPRPDRLDLRPWSGNWAETPAGLERFPVDMACTACRSPDSPEYSG